MVDKKVIFTSVLSSLITAFLLWAFTYFSSLEVLPKNITSGTDTGNTYNGEQVVWACQEGYLNIQSGNPTGTSRFCIERGNWKYTN